MTPSEVVEFHSEFVGTAALPGVEQIRAEVFDKWVAILTQDHEITLRAAHADALLRGIEHRAMAEVGVGVWENPSLDKWRATGSSHDHPDYHSALRAVLRNQFPQTVKPGPKPPPLKTMTIDGVTYELTPVEKDE